MDEKKIYRKETRELFLYNDIGPEWAGMIDAPMVVAALEELGSGELDVRINSYGGSVDQAMAIIQVLGRHEGTVRVSVDSIAASAASLFPVVFPSVASKGSRIMIHNPWTFALGNAKDLRKQADVLDTYRDSMLEYYSAKMKRPVAEIILLLEQETWFTAAEAMEAGLIDSVVDVGNKVKARAVPMDRGFKNIPQDLLKPPVAAAAEPPSQMSLVEATRKLLLAKLARHS